LKKLNKHLGEHLKPVKLFYDDIEEIYEILKAANNEVKIEADNYEIESLDEILTIKKPFFTNLQISIRNPYVSINFKNNEIWLYASEDTAIQRGLYEKLKLLINKKKRLFAPLLQNSIFSGLYLGTSFWWFLTKEFTMGLIIIITGLLWMYLGYKSQFQHFSIIVPEYSNNKPNFFIRNKDNIILAVISALLGGIITKILT